MIAHLDASFALVLVGSIALLGRFQNELPYLLCPALWHETLECWARICGLG